MSNFNTIIGKDILIAKNYFEKGEVVGIPTETVYGLAGNALNEDSVLKIFSAKNRPHFDPLIVHVSSKEDIEKYTAEISPKAQVLIEHFMPGPLTILLKRKALIPDLVTSGLDTVAIRIPQHPLTIQLLKSLRFPLAAPSANPFGYISPTTAQHVFEQLHGKIPYILDGGPATVGVESTIVGFEEDTLVVYRLGGVSVEEIEKVAGKVKVNAHSSSNPKAPGMLKSHYAPKKKMIYGSESFLLQNISASEREKKIGIIAFDHYVNGFDEKYQVMLSPKCDLNEAAKNLFAAMRSMDDSEVDIICAVEFPQHGLGRAINDRLKRAAT